MAFIDKLNHFALEVSSARRLLEANGCFRLSFRLLTHALREFRSAVRVI